MSTLRFDLSVLLASIVIILLVISYPMIYCNEHEVGVKRVRTRDGTEWFLLKVVFGFKPGLNPKTTFANVSGGFSFSS